MTFYNVTNPVMPTVLPTWLTSSSVIYFRGDNRFDHDLTLASTGLISNFGETGSRITVTSGSFNVTNAVGINLNLYNNLGIIGNITVTNGITITNASSLIIAGTLISGTTNTGAKTITTTSGGITLSGAVISGGELTLHSAGTITQAAGTGLTITGGKLNLSAGGAINLTSGVNRIGTVGLWNSGSSIAVTNETQLSLSGGLVAGAGGSIIITVNNNAGLKVVSGTFSSSGGRVILNLGKGVYDNLNGAANTTPGYGWDTENNDLTLNAGGMSYGNSTIFSVGTGKFRTNLVFTNLFASKHVYINDTGVFSAADQQRFTDLNSDAIFRS
ncbi:MAG: hypothetical protein ORO03_00720, partial [Alphaproteobacteria bacterium]|nr:hypothetical protein [Alphaproteobacteria bacterium]